MAAVEFDIPGPTGDPRSKRHSKLLGSLTMLEIAAKAHYVAPTLDTFDAMQSAREEFMVALDELYSDPKNLRFVRPTLAGEVTDEPHNDLRKTMHPEQAANNKLARQLARDYKLLYEVARQTNSLVRATPSLIRAEELGWTSPSPSGNLDPSD